MGGVQGCNLVKIGIEMSVPTTTSTSSPAKVVVTTPPPKAEFEWIKPDTWERNSAYAGAASVGALVLLVIACFFARRKGFFKWLGKCIGVGGYNKVTPESGGTQQVPEAKSQTEESMFHASLVDSLRMNAAFRIATGPRKHFHGSSAGDMDERQGLLKPSKSQYEYHDVL